LEAHLRCLQKLADRIRTHYAQAEMQTKGVPRRPMATEQLRLKLQDLERAGVNRKQMAIQCGTSSKTIVKLLGRRRFW